MKTTALTLLMSAGFVLPVFGQLNTQHNHYRAGDVLVKQQVEFADPEQAGENKLWDFSRVKTINDEYTLTYSPPPLLNDSVYIMGDKHFLKKGMQENELVVGTEHNTMYYYRLKNDTLLQLGHENPVVSLKYMLPMAVMRYPLNYGQSVSSDYRTKGWYSSTTAIQSVGKVTATADAYGRMILPSGDTLSPVLRVKTVQTLYDIPNQWTVTAGVQDRGRQVETCRWYSKGYRYPVFETVRSTSLNDDSEIFSTAFFFPPQDHLYLDTDPDNLALLDELWKGTEDNDTNNDQNAKTVTLEDVMTCKIYPNPVESQMSLAYDLKQDAKVSFELYSIEGLPIRKIKAQQKTAGTYIETLDCSSLRSNNYVFRITANGVFVKEIIIKK
jgi:hypothetical protein